MQNENTTLSLLDCTPSPWDTDHECSWQRRDTTDSVQAQYLSVKGLNSFCRPSKSLAVDKPGKIENCGILLTMTDSRTNYGQQIDNLIRGAYGSKIKVFDQTIPRSVRAAGDQCLARGKSIFQHDPKRQGGRSLQISFAKEVLADATFQ